MLLQLRSEFHFEDVILRHNFFLMAISSKVKLQHLSPRPPRVRARDRDVVDE